MTNNHLINAKLKSIKEREWVVTRIQDEMDRMIKIFAHMRECLENDLNTGFSGQGRAVLDKQIKQGLELAGMMQKVVDAKIRFEKSSKLLAESMTPEEELNACTTYIQSLDNITRKNWMARMKAWMKDRNEDLGYHDSYLQVKGPESSSEQLPKKLADESMGGDDTK